MPIAALFQQAPRFPLSKPTYRPRPFCQALKEHGSGLIEVERADTAPTAEPPVRPQRSPPAAPDPAGVGWGGFRGEPRVSLSLGFSGAAHRHGEGHRGKLGEVAQRHVTHPKEPSRRPARRDVQELRTDANGLEPARRGPKRPTPWRNEGVLEDLPVGDVR